MSLETRNQLDEYLTPDRRCAIAARVITLWTMVDIGNHLRSIGVKPPDISKTPNDSAQKMMFLAADGEYRKLRTDCLEVDPNSNAHIARNQMGFTTKTIQNKQGGNYVVTSPEFQIATYYLEDVELAEKINSSTGVSDILEVDGLSFKDHFSSRAIKQIDNLGDLVDLREIVNTSTRESEYWLEH